VVLADNNRIVRLLILQPTPFCNLDCSYCYLPDRESTRRLSLETIERLCARLFTSSLVGPELGIVWHAGEPLAVPVDFYAAALRTIDDLNVSNCQVIHSMQTNGTLITPAWCEFIEAQRIRIGVSIDGPAFLHDRNRLTRAKRGTHARVMRGIDLLRQYGIPFHAIVVLTREALEYPDEIFEFFIEQGVRQIGFNIDEAEGVHRVSSIAGSDGEIAYRRFMTRMFERVTAAGDVLRVREFERARMAIIQESEGRNDQVVPFGVLSVDCEGNFSTFSPELLGQRSGEYEGFVFGNVLHGGFELAWENGAFRKAHREIVAGVEKCRTGCEYFELCGGGAPGNKLFENGSFASMETTYCRCCIQVPIDVVLADLEASLRHAVTTPK
jgi:uncharacterized protein